MNRREFICAAVATGAAAVIPAVPAIATAADQLLKPAWAVGTSGEFDWQCFRADTAEEAIRLAAEEYVGGGCLCHELKEPDSSCEYCERVARYDADRVPVWDAADPVSGADWLAAGMGTYCSRCSYETFSETGGRAVNNEAVCEDCMTLADWDIVDPERAAEIREDLAEA